VVETVRITTAQAASVFGAARQRKILLSLIERERSLSQLERLTRTPLNLLHHHVGKLMQLRLARIARVEARAGAPIKYYRAAARRFFVPAELMGANPGAELTSRLQQRLERSLAGFVKGVEYSHDGNGPRMRLVKEPGHAVVTDLWLELRLSDADAAALDAELRGVFRRFEARSKSAHHPYLVRAAMAPA